jgi:hypothetical protein
MLVVPAPTSRLQQDGSGALRVPVPGPLERSHGHGQHDRRSRAIASVPDSLDSCRFIPFWDKRPAEPALHLGKRSKPARRLSRYGMQCLRGRIAVVGTHSAVPSRRCRPCAVTDCSGRRPGNGAWMSWPRTPYRLVQGRLIDARVTLAGRGDATGHQTLAPQAGCRRDEVRDVLCPVSSGLADGLVIASHNRARAVV